MASRVALLALALVALAAGCRPPEPARPRSFVILSIDTLGRSALRAFSEAAPPLPALDALAARSARFANATTTASWTLPAHASLLTGLYPDRHGATRPDRGLADALPTLAGALQAAGWRTVALVGGGYLDARYDLDRGFDVYDARREPYAASAGRDSVASIFARGAAFLAAPQPDPFLLVLHTYRLHDYFHVRGETLAALGRESGGLDRESALACLVAKRACAPAEWELLSALYAQELRFVDEAIGRLLALLERGGLAGSTYVFVVSDHGEGFDPGRGRISHGGRLHEDVIRIPVLVAGPDVSAGERLAPFSLVDVAPTVLELAGLPPPEGIDGVSAAAVLRGADATGSDRARFALAHAFRYGPGGRQTVQGEDEAALAVGVVRGSQWYIDGADGEELYEMARDPEQRRNRAADAPPELAGLQALARTRRDLSIAPRPLRRLERLQEQLESLGYVE